MTLLKDLEVGDIVFVEENKVPAKFLLVDKHAKYTRECGTIVCGIALVRIDPIAGTLSGTLFRGHPLLIISENDAWIDDSGILHGKEEVDTNENVIES